MLLTAIQTWTVLASDRAGSAAGGVTIEYASVKDISLVAFNASRIQILKKLSEHVTFEVFSHHPLDEKISIEIISQSIDTVFARLLGKDNFLVRYQSRSTRRDHGIAFRHHQLPSASSVDRLSSGMLNSSSHPLRKDFDYGSGIIEQLERYGDFDTPESIRQLTKFTRLKNVEQRLAVAESLGDIGSKQATKLLQRFVTDASSTVREAAIYALGDIGSPMAVRVLGLAIDDVNPHIRNLAISELTLIKTDLSVEQLMKDFHRHETKRQLKLLQAIAQINTPAARRYLWQSLNSDRSLVSITAHELLSQPVEKETNY